MTEIEIREALKSTGERVRAWLLDGRPVMLRYTPGNGTAYDLLFTPGWQTVMPLGGEMIESAQFPPEVGVVYVSRLGGSGGSYPWRWDHAPHANYVAEKWANDRMADGAAITLLFAAISQTEPMCSLADADIAVGD